MIVLKHKDFSFLFLNLIVFILITSNIIKIKIITAIIMKKMLIDYYRDTKAPKEKGFLSRGKKKKKKVARVLGC